MSNRRVPLAAALLVIALAFSALEGVSLYADLTGNAVTFPTRTDEQDGMVIEHRVGLAVSSPLGHVLVLTIIVLSTTTAFLLLRSRAKSGRHRASGTEPS